MPTREDAIRSIEGPLQTFIENNTNISLAEPVKLSDAPANYGVRVGVKSLETEDRIAALGLGAFPVPKELVAPSPSPAPPHAASLKVPVTKFVIGELRALELIHPSGPCPPGYSCGHPRMSAGTFGCLLGWDREPDHAYVLSNQHVLAGNNVGKPGDPIYQPGRYDGGTAFHTFARLAAFINLDHIAHNLVDAALARVENDSTPPVNWSDIVRPDSPLIGAFTGIADPAVGMRVELVGRSSEHSVGQVEAVDCFVYPDYGPGLGVLRFKGQVRTTPMALPGDSGAVVVEQSTNKIVGLLFAGGHFASVFTPIREVLAQLTVALGGGALTLK